MKKVKHAIFILSLMIAIGSYAQVQIDKAIQLTGSGTDAKVTGIQSITGAQDAVNANAVLNNTVTFATATGGANAYAVTLPTATAYAAGMVVQFIANGANTGSATLNVNALGAKTIMKNYNASLIANDIRNGQAVVAMFDGTNFQMLSQSGNGSGTSLAHGKQIFYFVGGPQYFTVPDGVTLLNVKLWGAGGSAGRGTGAAGGGSAFVSGTLTVTPDALLTVVVGQGGVGVNLAGSGTGTYGGGGPNVPGQGTGNGGGRSAIQISGADIVTAGGGGGGAASDLANYGNGGGGGAPTGGNGTSSSTYTADGGTGGTTAAGGTGGIDGSGNSFNGGDGSLSTGGTPDQDQTQFYFGGGGGGGYYGGGAGAGGDGTGGGGGGGGGSSYTSGAGFTLTSNQAGQTTANGVTTTAMPGGTADPDYQPIGFQSGVSGIGTGGNGNTNISVGGNGLVVISW